MGNRTNENQLVFLLQRLRINKEFFRRASERNRRHAMLVKMSIATLGAAITIVLGLRSTSLIAFSADDSAKHRTPVGSSRDNPDRHGDDLRLRPGLD